MWQFFLDRQPQFWALAYGHALLVLLAVVIGTVIGVAVAVVVTRQPRLAPVANAISSIGLTLPSFALVGLLLPLTGIGPISALICVTFYAIFPVMRNAVVGLQGVDATLVESARGMGMGQVAVLRKVQLPLAWPVILAGIRVSTQMSIGVAAIAAYVLGPGFGAWIFTGLTQIGGVNAEAYVLIGTLAAVVIALVFDLVLLALGRVTIPKGIRA
ncbi:ABC transporter permease [Nocardioides aequoreus]|uniref:ABC transporter permease n=1 Tax=Nocardioides aequoreus TaxID=397278 RepID=UPI000689640C|nr:ABC transporter permease [Nocardioides aequoreus]